MAQTAKTHCITALGVRNIRPSCGWVGSFSRLLEEAVPDLSPSFRHVLVVLGTHWPVGSKSQSLSSASHGIFPKNFPIEFSISIHNPSLCTNSVILGQDLIWTLIPCKDLASIWGHIHEVKTLNPLWGEYSSFISVAVIKYPDQKLLKEGRKGFIEAHNSKLQSITAKKSQWQDVHSQEQRNDYVHA